MFMGETGHRVGAKDVAEIETAVNENWNRENARAPKQTLPNGTNNEKRVAEVQQDNLV